MHNKQKKIAVINDFCGFGRCSLSVSVPIISAMKIQCCPVPTAIFSNHTGYDEFYSVDFTDYMQNYINMWKGLSLKFSGILTGFLGSEKQIDIVKSFFEHFTDKNTLVIVDPVMGDDGKLYTGYPQNLAQKMRELVPYADILTPNLTEACILTDTNYAQDMTQTELEKICKTLCDMGPGKIVISGLSNGDSLGNFIFEKGKAPKMHFEHRVGPCRAGTGDVFSSIIAADAVLQKDFEQSIVHASEFIAKCMRKTVELSLASPDGICFEEFLKEL